MTTSQEMIKAWWFDRLSDLVAQNMALAAELAAVQEQETERRTAQVNPRPNGGTQRVQEAQHG